MKLKLMSLFVTPVFFGLLTLPAKAQSGTQRDTTWQLVRRLVQSNDQSARDSLRGMLDTLQGSALESHVSIAANAYAMMKEKAKSDSLHQVIREKFPLGVAERNEAEKKVYDEKDPVRKEQLFYEWVKKFPASRYPDIDHDHIVYDYARIAIAVSYADAGNITKATYWIGQVEEDFYKGNAYGGFSDAFMKKGNLEMAAKYEKMAMLSSGKYYAVKDGDNAARFAGSAYVAIMTHYADILMKQKKYEEAAVWVQKAIGLQKEPNPALDFVYAKLLMRQHKFKEAFGRIEQNVKAGHASQEMIDSFKVLYMKVNGSDAGYDIYAENIHRIFLDNLHKQLVKDQLNLPAVNFMLTDLNGKTVSLEDLHGKTVVLDFWATWCGPCKASFPAMARTIEKYKDDSDVKFIFIHTWERDSTAALATSNAKEFIESHHYPFEVLMDLKDNTTGANKVVESYKVSGIPTKFVLDKGGRIRFRFTGFYGDDQAAVEELSSMIEMARGTGGAVTSGR